MKNTNAHQPRSNEIQQKHSPPITDFKESFIALLVRDLKLKRDVGDLDQVNLPAAKIAAFLFKSQLVEVELRGLLDLIEDYIQKKSQGLIVYRKSKFDSSQLGIGNLKNELAKYHNETVQKLVTKLSLFKEQRDAFTHNLYTQDAEITELAKEAERCKRRAEESMQLIENINRKLTKELY